MAEDSSTALVVTASPDQDPWLLAKERYLVTLDEDERKLFNEATIENLYYKTSNDARADRNRKTATAMRKLQPFVSAIKDYGQALDVFTNISSLSVAPIWGSIRVLLVLAEKYEKFYTRISDVLSRIGDILPRFKDFAGIFDLRKHPRLREAISNTYLAIMNLCMGFRNLLKTPSRISMKRVFKPLLPDSQYEEALEQFRRHKELVENEATACHMKEAAEARALVLRNRELQELREKVEKRKALLSRLSTINYVHKHQKLKQIRHKNSGLWVFAEPAYEAWFESECTSLLCFYGIPGCGKSVLVSSIIDALNCLPKPPIVIYYYCDYSDKRTLEPVAILGTFIRQLLELKEIPSPIESLITKIYDDKHNPEFNEFFELLKVVLDLFPAVTVVLDGFDELEDINRKSLLSQLNQLSQFECNLKLLLSSREDVSSHFTVPAQLRFRLHIQHSCLSNDIESYIRHSVELLMEQGDLVIKSIDLKQVVITTLVEKAQGMFLWVKFQLDDLSDAESDAEIKRVLHDLPKDLGETYERLLGRITGSQRRELARRMFQWIICARRPLHVEELREGIAFGIHDTFYDREKLPTDMPRLVRGCGNLVVIDEETQQVRLAHYTVQQYVLTDIPSITPGQLSFQFTHQDANNSVGESCMAYLCFSDFETQVSRNINTARIELVTLEKAVFNSTGTTGNLGYLANTMYNTWTRLHGWRNTTKTESPGIDYDRILPARRPPSDTFASYMLLSYIAGNWLHHTKDLTIGEIGVNDAVDQKRNGRFHDLVLLKKLPFSFMPYDAERGVYSIRYELLGWALENGHSPLLEEVLNLHKSYGSRATADFFYNPRYLDDSYSIQLDQLEYLVSTAMLRVPPTQIPLRTFHESTSGIWILAKIILSCQRGHIDVLRRLNDHNFQLRPNAFQFMVFGAATYGQLRLIKYLYDELFSEEDRSQVKRYLWAEGEDAYTSLDIAIHGGHTPVAIYLHKLGFRLNRYSDSRLQENLSRKPYPDSAVMDALLEVIHLQFSEVASKLHRNDEQTEFFVFAIKYVEDALERNETQTAENFLARTNTIYQCSHRASLLMESISWNHYLTALKLCDWILNCPERNVEFSVFMLSTLHKITDLPPGLVDALLDIGEANVNTNQESQVSILIHFKLQALEAAIEGKSSLVQQRASRIDLDFFNTMTQNTPLFHALVSRNLKVFGALVIAGANLEVLDHSCGLNPLFYAINFDMFDFIKILTNAGADLEVKHPETGLTPIWCALTNKPLHANIEILKCLVDSGAELTVLAPIEVEKNVKRLYLLEYAALFSKYEVFDFFNNLTENQQKIPIRNKYLKIANDRFFHP